MGRMIELMENQMRAILDNIYLGKTSEIIMTTRLKEGKEMERKQKELANELYGQKN